MAEGDRAAVLVRSVEVEPPDSSTGAEVLLGELLGAEGSLAGEHLRGEGFVELDHADIREAAVRLSERSCAGEDWAEAHASRVAAGPRVGEDPGQGLEPELLSFLFRADEQRGRAVADTAGVSDRDAAVGLLKIRRHLREGFDGLLISDPIISDEGARGISRAERQVRHDLTIEAAALACVSCPNVALAGVLVALGARDAEVAGDELCCLAHDEVTGRVSESLSDRDDWGEEAGAELGDGGESCSERLRAHERREHPCQLLAHDEGVGAHHLDADAQMEVGDPCRDLGDSLRDGLHAAGAVAGGGVCWDVLPDPCAQGDHAADVGGVKGLADTATDDSV